MSFRRLAAVAAVVLLASTIAARAQTRGTAPPQARGPATTAARTTLSGIYTAAQANNGEEIYFTFCVSCHPTVTYTGPAFKEHWAGKPLSDLYEWISEKMPKNEPGSLTPKQSVEAIAYILRLNKLPAGQAPLAPDYAALRRITIQLK